MKEITSILQASVNDQVIYGGTVLAGKSDKEIYCDLGVGYTSPERKYTINTDTVLDVASTTKVATVITALLICRSRGQIDFDAPFTEYLTDFSAPLYEPVTVRDLANHTSGFGDVLGQKQRLYFDESGSQMLKNMLTVPPPHPPTRHPHYSCWNYILLTLILERITGEKFITFCNREIFQPLKMSCTSLGAPLQEIPLEKLGQTIATDHPGEISDFVAKRIYRDGGCTGNAGLFTSAKDFAKLLKCYLHYGEIDSGHRLFSEKEMLEAVPDRRQKYDGYRRFGWGIYENYLAPEMYGNVLFHSGWSGQTILFDLTRDMYGIVLTTRCGDYSRAKKERFAILHRLWKMV